MSKMKVVKLCAGCDVGGHGGTKVWETVLAADLNNEAVATYVLNHAGKAVLADVLDPALIQYVKSLNPDVIVNSSGCQGFSAGQGKKMEEVIDDPRNDLYLKVVQSHVATIMPQWYVAENVVNVQKFPQFRDAIKLLYQLGYTVKVWQMNAADYGVAQSRTRVFVVARRSGSVPELPRKLFKKWPCLKDAFRELDEEDSLSMGVASISDEWTATMRLVAEGQNWKSLPELERVRILLQVRYLDSNWYRRYSWQDTAKTITTKPVGDQGFDPFHPEMNRPLSVVEHMILQGMNWQKWKWPVASVWSRYRVIGNGIPTVLVKAVAETIAAA